MNALIGIALVILIPVLIVVSSLWNGWAVWVVWNWWAPVIGEWLPVLSYAGAVGLAAIANLFTHHLVKSDNEEDNFKRAATAFAKIVLAPPIIVAGNWLILLVLI